MASANLSAKGNGTPAERAVTAIRAAILDSRFAPGQRLMESDLTRMLGLGRGPVREALRRLSVEGLVTLEHNRGAAVRRPSRAIMAEVFELRERLEGLAAYRAAERIHESDLRPAIEQALEEEARGHGNNDGLSLMDRNETLHDLILNAAQNETLKRLLGQLQLPELRSIFFRFMSPVIWEASSEDHVAILSEILAGRCEAAEQRMRAHVRRTAALFDNIPASMFS